MSPARPAPLGEKQLLDLKAPHVMPVFWTFAFVVLGVAVLCHLAFGRGGLEISILIGSLAMFVTTCVFAVTHWQALLVQLRVVGLFHWATAVGLLALAPLLALNFGYTTLLEKLIGMESHENLRQLQLGLGGQIVLICILPAITEELAFRGLVQHWLQVALRPARALLLASVLFTALHFSLLSAPYLLGVGMLLGWLKWKTGSLYPSMLVHFLHNLAVVVLFP